MSVIVSDKMTMENKSENPIAADISFSMRDIGPLIEELVGQGDIFRLTVSGTSMMPFLRNNRDEVVFAPPGRPYDAPARPIGGCGEWNQSGSFLCDRLLLKK